MKADHSHQLWQRAFVAWVASLVLVGLWVGHTLEYVRTAGWAGLEAELVGSVHVYMLPFGVTLVAFSALSALRLQRLWLALSGRVQATREALRRALRNQPVTVDPTELPTREARLMTLWPVMAMTQSGLYVIQENLESLAGGRPAPGLAVLTGRHWAATLIMLAVALVLAWLATIVQREQGVRVRAIEAGRRLAALIRRRRPLPAAAVRLSAAAWLPGPLAQLGPSAWRRPPPRLIQPA